MSVTLSWAVDADAINGYNVYRGTTSGGESGTPLNGTPILTTSYTDSSPVAGANYYVVKAIGSGGTLSPASGEVEIFFTFASALVAGDGTLAGNVVNTGGATAITGIGTVTGALISSSFTSTTLSGQASVSAAIINRTGTASISGQGSVSASNLVSPSIAAQLIGSAALYGTEINGTPAINSAITGVGTVIGSLVSTTPQTGTVSEMQTLIQAKASSTGSNVNPSLVFNNNVTIGDLLLAGVAYTGASGSPNVPSISDTQNNSWHEVGLVPSVLNGNVVNLILFWTIANATGPCTISASTSTITMPSGVWLVIAEFSGANELAIISGSTLGYGVNPPYDGSSWSNKIQAVNPPLTTPTGALMIVIATTSNATSAWSVGTNNNVYKIAAQGGGIVLAYAFNMYAGAPFCDLTPPKPHLQRSGDTSTQWVILSAPFTTTFLAPIIPNSNTPAPIPNFQYPSYPYDPASQE